MPDNAPTTTSFAILCLLAVKDWTTYELAQQMDRSIGGMWPRAASVVYEEPKRLVRLGLAQSSRRKTGRRASTVYSITDTGRAALAEWLAEPGAAPTLAYEALLKVAFADHGSIEGLRRNLKAIRDHAEADLEEARSRVREYAESGGPFPDRLPVIALAARFFVEQAEAQRRWIDWLEQVTSDWEGVTPDTGATTPQDLGDWL
ncbi:PadR family transcriptional regulator [Hoyosella altamirensis]|uniref:PadR family transcriptional regulator n=1 Tax=Hoyosella altamirensis TaxID=616997 RepID=UPI0007DB371E|nr:PadR family transcriptional regulator [Hoyosella altamirensis]